MTVPNVDTTMESSSLNPHVAPMRLQQVGIDDSPSGILAWPMIVAKFFQRGVEMFEIVREYMFRCT
jgi:hypothetical protein